MFLIVGLGNPEKQYQLTYHNIGFMVADKLAERCCFNFNKTECQALCGVFYFDDKKVIVAKPNTYMNLSGNSVKAFKNKYQLKNSQILVINDDIDLPIGTYRYKNGGSGGTHNGLRNIVMNIGSDFPRIRIGIGKPENLLLGDYVLSKIKGEKLEIIDKVMEEVVEIILDKIEDSLD